MLTVGSLFSGIGGFDLGLERAGMNVKWQCEIDPFCLKVLQKHWPDVPKYGDIRQLGDELGTVDLICGGPPCQPASCAGKRRGTEDDRWLWGETLRIVKLLRPRWCLFENPTGILSLQGGVPFESVLSELENQGYETAAFIIPACAVNAPHRRDRVWIVAWNTESARKTKVEGLAERENPESFRVCQDEPYPLLAYSECIGWGGRRNEDAPRQSGALQAPGSCAGDKQGILADTPGRERDDRQIEEPGEHQREWQRPTGGCDCASGRDNRRFPKPCMGRVAHGLSAGLAGHWDREPDIPRIATGVPDRVNKLKALGNAVVPQIVEILGKAIIEAERGELP